MGMNVSNGGRKGRRSPMSEINVTPFVDVMLVLLIIFMVTAPMMSTGVPVNLPDSRAKALEQPSEPIEVSIDAEGRVFLGTEDITDTLAERFTGIVANRSEGDAQVMLNADQALDYGRVMQVMGELNRAGLNQVALVTREGAAR